MADFTTLRCIDDFLINPTTALEQQPHRTAMLHDKHPLSSLSSESNTRYDSDTPEPKSQVSIKDLINEPVLWHGYTSEEEALSPVNDDDNTSLRSFDSLSSDFSMAQASETCTQAHAIKIQPAGKATVLSMPKIVDIPARRSISRPVSLEYNPTRRASVPVGRSSKDFSARATRTSQDTRGTRSISSRNNSISSTDMHSPASTAPSSIDEDEDLPELVHPKSFSRHVPLMEAAQAYSPVPSSAPSTPIMPRSATFGEGFQYSFASAQTRASIRRKKMLPSIATLNRLGKTFARRDSMDSRMDLENYPEPPSAAVTHVVLQPRVNTGGTRPKMVARGANERAPPISLPPFPDEENPHSEWPLGSDSHTRRKNMHRRMTIAQ